MARKRKQQKKVESVARVASVSTTRPGKAPSALEPAPAVKEVMRRHAVAAKDLAWRCDPASLPFRNTRHLKPLKGMLGQRRALKTLAMGLRIEGLGYNLFVCGLEDVESTSRLEEFARGVSMPKVDVPDYCYVQNFGNPNRPQLLVLPRGSGPRFQEMVHSLLDRLTAVLSKHKEAAWRREAQAVLKLHLPNLQRTFSQPGVLAWLRDWKRTLVQNIRHVTIEDFEVNCVKHSTKARSPILHERLPTYGNLFGGIGRRAMGDQLMVPHFTEISVGSVVAADGGVLLLHAADLQYSHGIWATLKSCLKYGTLQIEEGEFAAQGRGPSIKPDPIPLHVKVVLVGDYALYDHLFENEIDFRDVFKLRVDFDSEIALTSRVVRKEYPSFIARTCETSSLRAVTAAGVSRILEYCVRKAGRKNKISTQSALIGDLLREADYFAGAAGRRMISESDVERAIREGVERLNLVETKISEMISEGTILITTGGARVGQVNGLAIYDMGDYLFAKPSRITAETSVGHGGIINIEREAGFSGRSHDKGMHILGGYLRSRFAQNRPLSLTASLCFEQSYSGVDGDSASATEIYALLSSLSGLPIRQDIAVTGSLNQKGDVQPIGGVNEKIEGFFDCVQAGRPSGREGVIIPNKNVNDLMLRTDVARAVTRGRFHIYAIDKIDQGIEILTGVPVGRRRKDGSYTPGSVFARVDQRLEEIAIGLRRFGESDD